MSDNFTMPQIEKDVIPIIEQKQTTGVTPQITKTNQLIVGILPCLNHYFIGKIWPVIKPFVKEIADQSLGEYDETKVWLEVFSGKSHLYLCYIDNTPNLTQEIFQEVFITKHLSDPSKDFVGFAVVRIEEKTMHIWQAYVVDEYKNNNQFAQLAMKYIENQAKGIGLSYTTFAAIRQGWATLCRVFGYSETFTIYRKILPK